MQRTVQALKNTIVTCALVHMGLLLVLAINNQQPDLLNVFAILDLEYFIPSLGRGMTFWIVSWLCVVVLFLVYFKREKERTRSSL